MATRSRRPSAPRLDWEVLDQRTMEALVAAEDAIRSRVPLERVSYEARERASVGRGWLRKRAAKMPRSQALACALAETVAAFQRRRAEAVAAAMPQAQAWEVVRAAGLKGSNYRMVRDVIDGGSRRSS